MIAAITTVCASGIRVWNARLSPEALRDKLAIMPQQFEYHCTYGDLFVAQLIWAAYPTLHDVIDIDDLFVKVCSRHSLNVAKWLHSINPNRNKSVYKDAFRSACKIRRHVVNYVDTVKWLLSVEPDIKIFASDVEGLFWNWMSDSDVAWLLSIVPDNQKHWSWYKRLVVEMLKTNCINLAMVVALDAQQHTQINEELFLVACKMKHWRFAKWLYSIDPTINVSANNEAPFCFACTTGKLDVVKWLYFIDPTIDVSVNNEEPFRIACANGRLDIVKWLYFIKPTIDIEACDDYAFNKAVCDHHTHVLKWLCTVRPSKYIRKLMFATPVPKAAFETVTDNSVSDIEPCMVCFETITTTMVCLQTNCGHWMCHLCFNKLVLMSRSFACHCPHCRQPIVYATEYMIEQHEHAPITDSHSEFLHALASTS